MDVLKATTINAAKGAGQEKDMGTIEPGKLANLAVLSKNPLDDIRNTTEINAVVARGKFLNRADLDRLLSEEVKFVSSN